MTNIVYPAELPGPQSGSFEPRLRRAVSPLEGQLQQRARQRDAAGMTSHYTYTYTPAHMAVWLDWYQQVLLSGKRWFAASLPGNGGLQIRVVKYVRVQQRLLGNGVYQIDAEFEQRGQSKLAEYDDAWDTVVFLLSARNGIIEDLGPQKIVMSHGGGGPISNLISTDDPLFGNYSLKSSPTSRAVGSIPVWGITNRFTFEFWAKYLDITAGTGGFFSTTGGTAISIYGRHITMSVLTIIDGSSIILGDDYDNTNWAHIAIVYDGSYVHRYRNGDLILSSLLLSGNLSVSGAVYFGYQSTGDYSYNLVDEIRLSRHVRYDGPFTPPNKRFPVQ